MSKASGILLITLGVGVAAYAMPSHNEAGDHQPAQEMSVAKVDPADVAATAAAAATTATGKVTTQKVALPDIVPPIPKPAVRPTKDSTASAELRSPAAAVAKPIIVATSPRVYEMPAPSERNGVSIIPGDRVSLTRELQRELRRVGCYDGDVNGTWTPASRRAMKVFTDRVNASLPVDQPDYILLKLVQGSAERICGIACPTGQVAAGDGHCLPNAVIAQAARKSNTTLPSAAGHSTIERPIATTSGWSTTTTVAARDLPVPPEGRMALAGPGNDAAPVLARVPDVDAARQKMVERSQNKAGNQRKSKFAAVDNSDRRYAPEPRKKFGPWFFQQQDGARN